MTPATALLARARAIGAELWVEGDLLRWRCSGGLPEDLKADLTANKPAVLAVLSRQPDVQEKFLPETSHRNDRHNRCNRHIGAHRLWNLAEPNGDAWTSAFAPAQTLAEVLSRYAPGTLAAPVLDPDPADVPLPPDVVEAVTAFLDRIGETCPETRRQILQRAQTDPEGMRRYIDKRGQA